MRTPLNRTILILVLGLAMAPVIAGQMNDQRAGRNKVAAQRKAEQTVRKLEEELIKAGLRGDAATVNRLMADDYFFMTRDGVVHENLKAALLVRMKAGQSKADLLASLESKESDEPQLHPIQVADTQVHVFGETGVIMVRSSYQIRNKDGSVIEIPTRFLHVWVRRQGRWQLVAGSSTRIEQP